MKRIAYCVFLLALLSALIARSETNRIWSLDLAPKGIEDGNHRILMKPGDLVVDGKKVFADNSTAVTTVSVNASCGYIADGILMGNACFGEMFYEASLGATNTLLLYPFKSSHPPHYSFRVQWTLKSDGSLLISGRFVQHERATYPLPREIHSDAEYTTVAWALTYHYATNSHPRTHFIHLLLKDFEQTSNNTSEGIRRPADGSPKLSRLS